jgi:hypothetical protein
VYTCGPFNPNDVIEHIQVWEPVKVEHLFLDRELTLEELQIS